MKRSAICAILAGVLLITAAPASAWTTDFGHTGSRDRVLRDGCHNYRYKIVVKAPTDDWILETFLIDPRDERLASGAFTSESEPDKSHSRFRICRYTTQPGKFTIKAKLSWFDGSEEHRVRFKPSHFRLTRP
ncbi:MAG: hypothetical protein ACXWXO_19305 [Nocardioides sp.]